MAGTYCFFLNLSQVDSVKVYTYIKLYRLYVSLLIFVDIVHVQRWLYMQLDALLKINTHTHGQRV
jgi:hypothetical protein